MRTENDRKRISQPKTHKPLVAGSIPASGTNSQSAVIQGVGACFMPKAREANSTVSSGFAPQCPSIGPRMAPNGPKIRGTKKPLRREGRLAGPAGARPWPRTTLADVVRPFLPGVGPIGSAHEWFDLFRSTHSKQRTTCFLCPIPGACGGTALPERPLHRSR